MRGVTLNEDFISDCLGVKVNEAKPVEAKKEEKVSESTEKKEDHVCPLCESKLEAPISKEKLEEHVNYFLTVINENFDVEGEEESLDEVEEDTESEESEDGNA